MPTYIEENENQQEREKHPAGMANAVCLWIEDIGRHKGEWKGKEKIQRKLLFFWETSKKQADGKPFIISKKYTASMYESAQLRADLAAWNGGDFTEAELKRFDVDMFLGRPCLLNFVHTTDGKYSNIASITPLMDGMAPLVPVNKEKPEWLTKWVAKLRAASMDAGSENQAPPHDDSELPF